jgi:hypothetical protein
MTSLTEANDFQNINEEKMINMQINQMGLI